VAKKTLQEIIEALEPDTVRRALVDQQDRLKAIIAERVVIYQTEQTNPTYTNEAVRADVLKALEKEIIGWEELQQTIQERLKDSDGILKGLVPNRAARRRSKNGASDA